MMPGYCVCTGGPVSGPDCVPGQWEKQQGRMVKMEDGINPKDIQGMKKPPLRLVPPALLIWTSKAMAEGARKYGPYNWRTGPPVQLTIYIEAAMRHLQALLDGEDIDPDSGLPHAAKVAACMGIILDATELDQLKDDRTAPGPGGALIARLTESSHIDKVKSDK